VARILDATCENNIVKVEGKTVPATILSQGKKASTGAALLQHDQLTYVTSNATDIKDLITQLSTLIDKIETTFTDIASGMTGPTTAPPPALTADLLAMTNIKTALDLMKDNLK